VLVVSEGSPPRNQPEIAPDNARRGAGAIEPCAEPLSEGTVGSLEDADVQVDAVHEFYAGARPVEQPYGNVRRHAGACSNNSFAC